ncbi:MAG: phosphoribosylaminoimidazolesuccinocarboxamide synthase [Patescibacteria group bacterium]|jgi:phosphoribosylaminoimidazole-succinocarboxamide synthase
MATLPQNLKRNPLTDYLSGQGLKLTTQGKVRDTWFLDESKLLFVATDRISIFDSVLNASVPKKGEVLTALTHFWLTKVMPEVPCHLIYSKIKRGANGAYDLKRSNFPELPLERCLLVKNMQGKIFPFEMIYRGCIGGSVWSTYQETGTAGGHVLPQGLTKWSKLDPALFTPSTKEEVGHDINVNAQYYYQEMGNIGRETETLSAYAYESAYEYAIKKGIMILDTKFEVAPNMIVDEVLTPDSSRFSTEEDWKKAIEEKRDPIFYDKQIVRDWGEKVPTPFTDNEGETIIGIKKLKPGNPEHLAFIHGLIVPEEIIAETTKRYLTIFEWLTGVPLETYQKEEMYVF